MKKPPKKISFFFFAILIISFLIIRTRSCPATTVWSDNFDDGNYDGWTVQDGNFSVAGQTLRAGKYHARINCSSEVAYGTWSFEVLIN
jgi:hypothetical protein